MDCSTCENWASTLIDGELALDRIAEIQAHLEGCDSCCRLIALLLCDDVAARKAELQTASERLWSRIEDRLPASTAQSPHPMATSPPEILLPKEAAAYLRIGESELFGCLTSLPHFSVGDLVRFRRRSLDAWIRDQEQTKGVISPDLHPREDSGKVIDFVEARSRLTRFGNR